MTKRIYTVLALILALSITSAGCGKKEETSSGSPVAPEVTSQDETAEEEASKPKEEKEAADKKEEAAADTAKDDKEKSDAEKGDDEKNPEPTEAAPTPEAPAEEVELPEYLTGDFVENAESETEGGIAEGANTYEGEMLSLTKSAQEINIGDEMAVTGEAGNYLIKIESVEVTDERNEYLDTDPDKVVKVRYTYTEACKEPVLVGQICFRLMNKKTEAYDFYMLDSTSDPEAAPAPSENGTPVTASLAFAVEDGETDFTLIFDDAVFLSGTEYYIHVKI